MAEKEGRASRGGGRSDSTRLGRAVASRRNDPSVRMAAGGDGFPTTDIEPIPARILHVPLDRIVMLAAAPRSRWSDPAWAAFCGFLGSVTSAGRDLYDAYFVVSPPGLKLEPAAEVVVAIVFLTWSIVAFFSHRHQKTAAAILAELIPGPIPPTHILWGRRLWSWHFSISRPAEPLPPPAQPDTPERT